MKSADGIRTSILIGVTAALAFLNAAAQDLPRARTLPELERVKKADPVVRLRLPNLHPARVHFRTYGGAAVEACVDVDNRGSADSTPTDVKLGVVVIDPRTLGAVSSRTLQLSLPAVRPGVRPTEVCGSVSLPNRTEDWDLHGNAHVDPGNNVLESNESDNQRTHDCRVFGNNPGSHRIPTPAC